MSDLPVDIYDPEFQGTLRAVVAWLREDPEGRLDELEARLTDA